LLRHDRAGAGICDDLVRTVSMNQTSYVTPCAICQLLTVLIVVLFPAPATYLPEQVSGF
jgi:hypothetical protein